MSELAHKSIESLFRSKQFYKSFERLNQALTFVRHGSEHCAEIPRLHGVCLARPFTSNNNNNNNNTLFNEDLQIKLQLVQLVSNLVLLSSRNILHHVITILMQLTYFRHVVLCIYSRGCVTNTQHTQIHHNHTTLIIYN